MIQAREEATIHGLYELLFFYPLSLCFGIILSHCDHLLEASIWLRLWHTELF